MVQRALAVLIFAFTAALATAQGPTPSQAPPPALDSCNWQIHNGSNQPMGYHVEFELVGISPLGSKIYTFRVIETRTGEDTGIYGAASTKPNGFGYALDVWSSDSGNTYGWQWDGNHYDKVGGTSAVRSYHPM